MYIGNYVDARFISHSSIAQGAALPSIMILGCEGRSKLEIGVFSELEIFFYFPKLRGRPRTGDDSYQVEL